MGFKTRICTAKTYSPVAGDERLLVKVDDVTWISDTPEERFKDEADIEAYLKGQKQAGNMVFINYDGD